MSVNIGKDNADDAFYRYKMPKLVAKIEGRGNGIKTNVVNNVDIAKALARPPEYIIKYFGGELGAQTRFDAALGTSIVNGAHDAPKLVELLEGFIKKYVQCYSCGNPETVIRCRKENISLKCKACGAKSDVDPRLKLNGFIIKNPPPSDATKADKQEAKIKAREKERLKGLEDGETPVKEKKEKKDSLKKDKDGKEKKRKKKEKEGEGEAGAEGAENEGSGNASASDDSDDDTEWLADTSAEAAAARAREQLSAATAALVVGGELVEGAVPADSSAGPADSASTSANPTPSSSPSPNQPDIESLVAALRSQCTLEEASRNLRGLLGNKKASEIGAIYADLEVTGSGGPAAKARALYEALFLGSEARLPALMDKFKLVLKACAPDEDAMAQACQLLALEHFVGVTEPHRIKETPFALKVLFEFGIIDEEVIEGWADSQKAGQKLLGIPAEVGKQVREAAEPFLTWLAEAESSEEDEDD